MKCHVIELPSGKIGHFTIALVIILTLTPLYYLSPSSYVSFPWNSSSSQKLSSAAMPPPSPSPSCSPSSPSSFYSSSGDGDSKGVSSLTSSSESGRQCDIFSGEWIPNPEAPYYTNMSCMAIHEHQNCMKYGRPDLGFLKWRWKPDECELPIFNPTQFFETVRGKSMAFVGDSVARNQAQSLICLLSQVMYPVDVSYTRDEDFKRWNYTTYNFTLSTFWTPYLVKIKEADPNNPNLFNLYLDEFDEKWTSQIEEFDYVIISAGHWFYRPIMFYEKGELIGCHYCFKQNIKELNMFYGYRKAFNTAFKAINSLSNYKGLTFLRTFAPSHFENGEWNLGGNCLRTKPFKRNETQLEGRAVELYKIQLEEFRIAEMEGKKKGLRYGLLDTTEASLLRPDGHPSLYGHKPQENVTLYNDCVHWCLPGPIDTWNDFLLEMLKMIR